MFKILKTSQSILLLTLQNPNIFTNFILICNKYKLIKTSSFARHQKKIPSIIYFQPAIKNTLTSASFSF